MELTLNYKTFGQGHPIIILHGLFGTLDNWNTIGRKLGSEYSVYLLDQRNHGRSPHTEVFNYEVMAEDLRHFMENNWIYKAHIIGHSMGGKTAMTFALNYPEMVDKLMVIDISTRAYAPRHHHIFEALNGLQPHAVQNRTEAEKRLLPFIEDYGERQFLLKNLKRKKEGGYAFKMNLPAIHANYESIIAAVEGEEAFEGPALFVKGGKSRHILEGELPEIRSLFPNANMLTIEEAGHWVHADAPENLLKAANDFFSGSP